MSRGLIAAMVVLAGQAHAQTHVGGPVDPERPERCAVRLAIALTGKSPGAALLSSGHPQLEVDALLATDAFIERFARFINSSFNDTPSANSVDDAAYHLSKHVLANGKPWRDVFVGPYDVAVVDGQVVVRDDANGLGFYRSKAWLERYAGNEEQGVKLATAYRMLNNTTGLKLTAAVQTPGADFTVTGRQNAACRGCHFDGWFALDRVASVLTRKVVSDGVVSFAPPTAGPQALLDGRTISNDQELITALVRSEAFDFRVCRLAFQFLYGRNELSCEGPLFDRCVDAFREKGTIQAAVATVAKDAAYCQ